MSNIYYCEQIKRRIENNPYFNTCFKGDILSNFSSQSDILVKCRKCYDNITEIKNDIINVNYDNKINEKAIKEMEIISMTRYEIIKKKYENDEEKEALDNEINIEKINQENELKRQEYENNIKIIDNEINNLKMEIDKLKEQDEKELNNHKKIILNKIKNEYKLKLVKYQSEIKKQFSRAVAQDAVRRKNFEVKKELEKNDLKNRALLIQELIAILKSTLLNN